MSSAVNSAQIAPVVLMPIGNRWRGDDAAGPAVLDLLADDLAAARSVRVVPHADDAMTILNNWEGAGHVLVIDAAVTGAAPGTIHRFDIDVRIIAHQSSAFSGHGMGLAEAIELGSALGRLPERLTGWAIEAESFDNDAPLSEAVRHAVAEVAEQIRAELVNNHLLESPDA